jgi:hypothetical protein
MSLSSLKKSAPSAEVKALTVDEFIQGADFYAHGLNILPLKAMNQTDDEPLKRATFTLGKVAIGKLNALSVQTGIAKSRLIRLWLDSQDIKTTAKH